MLPGLRADEDDAGFIHIGHIREEEYPDSADDWADPDDEVPVQPPRRVRVDTSGFSWALNTAILQRYAPRLLYVGDKPRHTDSEYVQITERAFWRILDILWKKESFQKEMTTILQKNDKKYGRNNYQTLLSGRRPT